MVVEGSSSSLILWPSGVWTTAMHQYRHLLRSAVVVKCNTCSSVVSSISKTAILMQASAQCEHGVQKASPKHTSRSTLFVTHVQGLGQGEAGEGAHCQQQNWT